MCIQVYVLSRIEGTDHAPHRRRVCVTLSTVPRQNLKSNWKAMPRNLVRHNCLYSKRHSIPVVTESELVQQDWLVPDLYGRGIAVSRTPSATARNGPRACWNADRTKRADLVAVVLPVNPFRWYFRSLPGGAERGPGANGKQAPSKLRSEAKMAAAVLMTIMKKRRQMQWWKYGPSPTDRQHDLEDLVQHNEESLIKRGVLMKTGARIGDAWNRRYVALSDRGVAYYYYDDMAQAAGTRIDCIPIGEIERVEQKMLAGSQQGASDLQEEQHSVSPDTSSNPFRRAQPERDQLAAASDSAFVITTKVDGIKEGRKYIFKADSAREMLDWIDAIVNAKTNYRDVVVSDFEKFRLSVKTVYNSAPFQILVAVFIGINFICNAVEAEMLPQAGDDADRILKLFDLVFVALFSVELAINMFANLFWDFFSDGWNYFDTFVVIISLVATFAQENPGLNVLRMVRAFRVFRLFRRLKSLGQIISAINQSLPAVGNAFFLVLLMTSIFAIMGVSFFRDQYPDGFDTFSVAMYTMFQIMTFDDSGEVAMELMSMQSSPGSTALVALYTISFQLIVGFILLNIVMAVLLDKFTEASENSKSQDAEEAHSLMMNSRSSVIDPLLDQLSQVETDAALSRRIQEAFRFIDEDLSGLINFEEMRNGFLRMETDPAIDFTLEHYTTEIVNMGLARQDGSMDMSCFNTYIQLQLKRYVQKQMSNAARNARPDQKLTAILRSLQQTTFVTHHTQKTVLALGSNMTVLVNRLENLQNKIRNVEQKSANKSGDAQDGYQSGCRQGTALEATNPRASTDDKVLQKTDVPTHSEGAGTGRVRESSTAPDAPLTKSVLPNADPITLSSITPIIMSPTMDLSLNRPRASPAYSFEGATPASTVKSPLDKSSLPTSTASIARQEYALDIQGLNARVDAMQERLVRTIQQAKAVRKSEGTTPIPPDKSTLDGSNFRSCSPQMIRQDDLLDVHGLNARVDAMHERLVRTIQQAKAARERTRAVFGLEQSQARGTPSSPPAMRSVDTSNSITPVSCERPDPKQGGVGSQV